MGTAALMLGGFWESKFYSENVAHMVLFAPVISMKFVKSPFYSEVLKDESGLAGMDYIAPPPLYISLYVLLHSLFSNSLSV